MSDLDNVITYYLDQAKDETRPPEVLLSMCRLRWPNRKWSVILDDVEDGLCVLSAIRDEHGTPASSLAEPRRFT